MVVEDLRQFGRGILRRQASCIARDLLHNEMRMREHRQKPMCQNSGIVFTHIESRHFAVAGAFERRFHCSSHFLLIESRVLNRDPLFAASPRTLPRVHFIPRLTPDPFHNRLSRFEPRGGKLLPERTEFGGESGDLVERDERLEAQETLTGEGERGRKRGKLGTDFSGLLREPSELRR